MLLCECRSGSPRKAGDAEKPDSGRARHEHGTSSNTSSAVSGVRADHQRAARPEHAKQGLGGLPLVVGRIQQAWVIDTRTLRSLTMRETGAYWALAPDDLLRALRSGPEVL